MSYYSNGELNFKIEFRDKIYDIKVEPEQPIQTVVRIIVKKFMSSEDRRSYTTNNMVIAIKDADGSTRTIDESLLANDVYWDHGDKLCLIPCDAPYCRTSNRSATRSNGSNMSLSKEILVTVVLIVILCFLVGRPIPADPRFVSVRYFSEKENNEIKNNILAKIQAEKKSDPLSIFIAVPPKLKNESRQIAKNITNFYHFHSKVNSMVIDVNSRYWRLNERELEVEVDEFLSTSNQAIIIHDFVALPWRKAKLFFRYCDNENAPYKSTLFVFLSQSETCEKHSPHSTVMRLLTDRWRSDIEVESVEALATRVSAISVCMSEHDMPEP